MIGFQEVRLEVAADVPGKKRKKKKKKHHHLKDTTQPQVSQLAVYLPDHQFVYQPAMFFEMGLPAREEEGLAIFSRYSIVSTDYKLLYRHVSKVLGGSHFPC